LKSLMAEKKRGSEWRYHCLKRKNSVKGGTKTRAPSDPHQGAGGVWGLWGMVKWRCNLSGTLKAFATGEFRPCGKDASLLRLRYLHPRGAEKKRGDARSTSEGKRHQIIKIRASGVGTVPRKPPRTDRGFVWADRKKLLGKPKIRKAVHRRQKNSRMHD